jgi:glycerol 2-dehydrogenase (NADP+)
VFINRTLLSDAMVHISLIQSHRLHPYLAQNELVQWCKGKGIVVVAYAATGEDDSLTSFHS